MKFQINLDSKEKDNALSLDTKVFFIFVCLSILISVCSVLLFNFFDDEEVKILAIFFSSFMAFFLIKTEIVFEMGFVVLQSYFGLFQKKIEFNNIKEVSVDSVKSFHIFLNDGKEFVFRARRNSEYEDLKNQFYSVGLFKN